MKANLQSGAFAVRSMAYGRPSRFLPPLMKPTTAISVDECNSIRVGPITVIKLATVLTDYFRTGELDE